MIYAVEAWQFSSPEEPCEEEMIECNEMHDQDEAMRMAWEYLEQGFQVRMYRR